MNTSSPVALITGASKRIGKEISEHLHTKGYQILIHFHQSQTEALELESTLNQKRAQSAVALHCDLSDPEQVSRFADQALSHWERIDLLINNASTFTPDPHSPKNIPHQWHNLMNTNALANLILSRAFSHSLKAHAGSIINLIDIYSHRPLQDHSIYSTSKAACEMLTKSMALELAPEVRVNGISPGAILWPDNEMSETAKQKLLDKVPLQRTGSTQAIVEAVDFLVRCNYITGQVIAVDGGRTITI